MGGWLDLPERLVAQLPTDEYRVAVITHPGILAKHSPWQVRAWLSRAERCGAVMLPPEDGWQAALTAASCVISDHGSLSLYAAALDKPLLLTPGGPATTVPGSATAALAAHTVRIDPDGDLRAQIEAAVTGHVTGVNGELSESDRSLRAPDVAEANAASPKQYRPATGQQPGRRAPEAPAALRPRQRHHSRLGQAA